jgi:capsular polysaccharide biosynthesis protein
MPGPATSTVSSDEHTERAGQPALTAAPRILPRIGVLESVRRHKLLAALPLIVLVIAALVYSFARTPNYTAESYQSIGRLDVNEPGTLSGFQEATETLAVTYARGIYAPSVVSSVSKKSGLSPDEVRSRLAAYTVPESAVFVVAADGSSEDDAIQLSVQGSDALQRYIRTLNAENPNSVRLFREFRRQTATIASLREQYVQLSNQFGPNRTAAERQQLSRLESRIGAAQLERQVAEENYQDSQASQSAINVVQTLALPDTADSDRFERLQIALFIAVCAGVLLGLAFATYRSNRDIRRVLSVS